MADIMMRVRCYQSLLDDTGTEVTFSNLDEPLTCNDLCQLFIRFATACGFSERGVAETMIGIGNELLPSEILYDEK